MYLVLDDNTQIDERLSRTYGAIRDMENNIDFCNRVIREYIDPITNNEFCISVQKTLSDYDKLMQLATLLRSNETKEMFTTIKKELGKNLPSNLASFPIPEIKDFFDSLLQADDINQVIKNIKYMLSKRGLAKNDTEDSYHLINFIGY